MPSAGNAIRRRVKPNSALGALEAGANAAPASRPPLITRETHVGPADELFRTNWHRATRVVKLERYPLEHSGLSWSGRPIGHLGMGPIRARLNHGRLIVSEPTDLPEGTLLELVQDDEGDDRNKEERKALHAEIRRSVQSAKQGKLRTAAGVIAELRTRSHRRRASPDSQVDSRCCFQCSAASGARGSFTPSGVPASSISVFHAASATARSLSCVRCQSESASRV